MKPRQPVYIQDGTIWIFLTKGKVAVVDSIDEDLAQLNWYATLNCGVWYAVRKNFSDVTYMHRLIGKRMGLDIEGNEVDHIDLLGINNVRSNLRVATHSQNKYNRGKSTSNTSGRKGVTWCKGKWMAQIVANRRYYYLGRFVDINDASAAYDKASKELHGEFSRSA